MITEPEGSFSLLYYVKDPLPSLRYRLSRFLNAKPLIIDFGNEGQFFLYTSYGAVAQDNDSIIFKAGFIRSLEKFPLSTDTLLEQKIVTSDGINSDALRGNALLAGISKLSPQFTVFKTLLSQYQFYYWASDGEFIASDNMRCLLSLIPSIEMNEAVLPFHFLFYHMPGSLTYIKHVQRLLPGQLLKWRDGRFSIHHVQKLCFSDNRVPSEYVDTHTHARDVLYQELTDITGAYIREIEDLGYGFGNLLSGGVDSSIIQLIINEKTSSKPAKSFSFVPVEEASYEFEVKYARQAADIFKTSHKFVNFCAKDYPDLLVKTIATLGQPMITHIEPCKLLLASFLSKNEPNNKFFFTALGADVLFGLNIAKKIRYLDFLCKVPGASLALLYLAKLLEPFTDRCVVFKKGAEILADYDNQDLFVAPVNTIATWGDIELICSIFGSEIVRKALEYRRSLEKQYLDSSNCIEKVHIIGLLNYFYEIEAQSGQLFLAYDKELVYPFFDDAVIRMSFTFRPEIRYMRGFRVKPLLKDILEHRNLSSIARQRKGATGFDTALKAWMRSGPLNEMLHQIDRPGFLSKADFDVAIESANEFAWGLLTLDVFKKQVLS
ncbi:MAG: hypothetical protein JW981_03430 [Anaerolineae bacterium]|nr:hypothetical protein [Anaerolineae bacterium]